MNRLQDTTNFLKTYYYQHFQIVSQWVKLLSQVGFIIRENASALTMNMCWLFPKFFKVNIIFGIYLGFLCFRPENHSFFYKKTTQCSKP